MDSIRKLYKVGSGPSSSHTMGPKIAAEKFKADYKKADNFIVTLYGSLAETGKGHLTDYIIKQVLGEFNTTIIFDKVTVFDYHPNGMKFEAYESDQKLGEWLVFSVGGGSLRELNEARKRKVTDIYPHHSMEEILKYTKEHNMSLVDYVIKYEGQDIIEFAHYILDVMTKTVNQGLNKEGYLPGKLKIKRKAMDFFNKYEESKDFTTLIFALSLATAEENASGGEVVTAPTCGSSGVLPGALLSYYFHHNCCRDKIAESLLVAGLIGNLVKYNASISGAEVGCQGEVGTACSMASAAITYLFGGDNDQIEYAAEIGLEHHLGMTCDPVMGYVQIPCIERNALASKRAYDSAQYAILTNGTHHIMLDSVIQVMKETGHDMNEKYKETSKGGLALRTTEEDDE